MPHISPTKLQQVFNLLLQREVARKLSNNEGFYSVQNSQKNRADNRYSNILAYDRTAVVVDGRYLNANKVEDGKGGVWIAAQAPPPKAFDTFFRALHTGVATGKQSSDVILVQLTGWEEGGMRKADFYLEHAMEDLPMNVIQTERKEAISSTITELQLDQVKIHHYHFDAWPDHGVPKGNGVVALRRLIDEVEQRRKELGCEVWVHCSAGVGRTGSFIALSSLSTPGMATQPSELPSLPSELSEDRVARTVDAIRECRALLVQNADQLRLIYEMQ